MKGYSYEHGFIWAPPVRLVMCNLIAYNVSYPLSRSCVIYAHMDNWTYEDGVRPGEFHFHFFFFMLKNYIVHIWKNFSFGSKLKEFLLL